MEEKNNKELSADVNRCKFVLVTNPNASFEDYGWTEEFVEDMLYIEANEPDHEWMSDPEILNNLGIVYCDGVGTDINMERAIMYYAKAAELGDDLAKSNLADIYRKGKNGVAKDFKKSVRAVSELSHSLCLLSCRRSLGVRSWRRAGYRKGKTILSCGLQRRSSAGKKKVADTELLGVIIALYSADAQPNMRLPEVVPDNLLL